MRSENIVYMAKFIVTIAVTLGFVAANLWPVAALAKMMVCEI